MRHLRCWVLSDPENWSEPRDLNSGPLAPHGYDTAMHHDTGWRPIVAQQAPRRSVLEAFHESLRERDKLYRSLAK